MGRMSDRIGGTAGDDSRKDSEGEHDDQTIGYYTSSALPTTAFSHIGAPSSATSMSAPLFTSVVLPSLGVLPPSIVM